MKKLLLLLLLPFFVHAQPYYFAASGSDGAGCTIGAPCKTITKANTLTGDKYFNGGDTFTGTLLPHTGEHIQSYNTGQAIFSGFETLTGWVNGGGGIWHVVDANLNSTLNVITIGGVIQPQGRYPHTGYLTFTAHVGNTSITGTLPNTPSYLTGNPQLVIRKNHFTLDVFPLTGQAGGVLTYTGAGNNPTNGGGYFIQGAAACLTNFGDWYYNSSTHTVYMYFGVALPTSYTIKASATNSLVSGNVNYFISNIHFDGANQYGVFTNGASTPNIQGCTFTNIGIDGISCFHANNPVVQFCTFSNCLNASMVFNFLNAGTIANITTNNIGMWQGAGLNIDGTGGTGSYSSICVADAVNSNHYTIRNCKVTNTGYNGIQYAGDYLKIYQNYVSGACNLMDDGGSLYTHGQGSIVTYHSRIVRSNIVQNPVGAPSGTSDGRNEAVNIYCDDNSSNLLLDSNTCSGAPEYNMFIHNNQTDTIRRNLLFNAGVCNLAMVHDGIALPALIRNMVINNNDMVANASGQFDMLLFSIALNSTAADFTSFGTSNNNRFWNIFNNASVFNTQLFGHAAVTKTLATWQVLTAQDLASTYTHITAATLFLTNPAQATNSFSLSGIYKDLNGTTFSSGSISLLPYRSSFLIFQGLLAMPHTKVIVLP